MTAEVSSLVVGLVCGAIAIEPPQPTAVLSLATARWCLDCHGPDEPEAGLDLTTLANHPTTSDAGVLRRVRDRLARGDMPPGDDREDRPDADEYAELVAAANAELDRRAAAARPGRPALRRLNRVEYRNTVRDLLGIEIDAEAILPADDVGDGFDSIGAVLSLSPIALEKYLSIAERVAVEAIPPDGPPLARRVAGHELAVTGGGAARDEIAYLWSRAAAEHAFDLPRAGRYRLRFGGWGMQAGPDPVRVALVAGGEPRRNLGEFDLPETSAAPGERSLEVALAAGESSLGVVFLNDFYDKSLPPGEQDRNLAVTFLEVEGPIDSVAPTREAAAMFGDGSIEDFAKALATRAYRRPPAADEVARLLAAAEGASTIDDARRAMIVRALVDPRFLFRFESDPVEDLGTRDLDGYELATRLSYLLWASMPDDRLLAAAARGELADEAGLRREADRLIDSPRSIALAERFGQQWLHISAVESRMPDPRLLEGLSPLERTLLLEDLKGETTLFLDAILRNDRPVEDLLAADWTYLNERLARHYGIGGVRGSHLRMVEVGDDRPPGLLGHGSVLVATSNPSRTSPVKRGKWVLESLLDSPPPPPPPGVATLPDRRAAGDRETAREQLARHRADPNCVGCHLRMDELGLAFEAFDAAGRVRTHDGDAAIDSSGSLPDGRAFAGPWELAAILRTDPGFRRSIVKHLMTYALGRGLSGDDEATVDHLARTTSDPSLRALVHAVIASDPFRRRSPAAPEDSS